MIAISQTSARVARCSPVDSCSRQLSRHHIWVLPAGAVVNSHHCTIRKYRHNCTMADQLEQKISLRAGLRHAYVVRGEKEHGFIIHPFVLSSETRLPLVSIRFTIAWYRRRRQSSMKLNLSKILRHLQRRVDDVRCPGDLHTPQDQKNSRVAAAGSVCLRQKTTYGEIG